MFSENFTTIQYVNYTSCHVLRNDDIQQCSVLTDNKLIHIVFVFRLSLLSIRKQQSQDIDKAHFPLTINICIRNLKKTFTVQILSG